MKQPIIPKLFVERHRELLGKEVKDFLECIQTKQFQTIRLNSFKNPEKTKKLLEERGLNLEKVSFAEQAFTVKNTNFRLGLLPEHETGLFYVQEKASMISAIALNPSSSHRVLDLAAAPGSKTTQLSELMKNNGSIIALDNNKLRLKALLFNLERIGCLNVLVVKENALSFQFKEKFDRILLDAPCSSEGIVRKKWNALSYWSMDLVKEKSRLQKKLIVKAFELLKENGLMSYSTCTLAPEENEEVVNYLIEKYPNARVEKPEIKNLNTYQGITKWKGRKFKKQIENCLRVYPHLNDSSAFFLSLIRKVG
ncbi:MAG: NOL1/NOP2/sun family putative RNA methylase [archaeon]